MQDGKTAETSCLLWELNEKVLQKQNTLRDRKGTKWSVICLRVGNFPKGVVVKTDIKPDFESASPQIISWNGMNLLVAKELLHLK